MELSSSKIKKFLILSEMELPGLIFFLIFQKGTFQASKIEKILSKKFFIFFQKKLIFQETKLSYIFSKKVFLIFLAPALKMFYNQ